MIAFYYLYDAKKRMKEIQRFIKGTPDIPMLLAQRDIIQAEIDHYTEESLNLIYFILTLIAFCSILYVWWYIGSTVLHIIRMFS
jgi:hypothetical protein